MLFATQQENKKLTIIFGHSGINKKTKGGDLL